MSRQSIRIKRLWLLSALAAMTSIPPAAAHAQITLRPAPEVSDGYAAEYQPLRNGDVSSRREHPISRSTAPGLSPTSLEAPVFAGDLGDRSTEYARLSQEAEAFERQFGLVRRIVRFASPSIVHIEATKTTDPGRGFASSRVEEAGAGVIVSFNGGNYVLTNRHVVHPSELNAIRLELNNGRVLYPSYVWTDPSTDVAVMKVDANDLVPAMVGDSDAMDIGDFVLAVGSPFGLSHSVTYGILSAKGRRNLELGSKEIEIQDFFQTDAAINPGNSGGPLLNLRGEVVGINTAIASNSGGNEGIGFSIPINMAVLVAKQLVDHGRLLRSYLGVQMENTFDIRTARSLGLQTASGALVKSILDQSPAAKAGLRVGDVIVEFNGRRIENDGHLVKTVGLTPVGSQVDILVYRDGSPVRLRAALEASPDQG